MCCGFFGLFKRKGQSSKHDNMPPPRVFKSKSRKSKATAVTVPVPAVQAKARRAKPHWRTSQGYSEGSREYCGYNTYSNWSNGGEGPSGWRRKRDRPSSTQYWTSSGKFLSSHLSLRLTNLDQTIEEWEPASEWSVSEGLVGGGIFQIINFFEKFHFARRDLHRSTVVLRYLVICSGLSFPLSILSLYPSPSSLIPHYPFHFIITSLAGKIGLYTSTLVPAGNNFILLCAIRNSQVEPYFGK